MLMAHFSLRGFGAGEWCGLRARISMIIIAAPQSGQTKVGWAALSDTSASVLRGFRINWLNLQQLTRPRKIDRGRTAIGKQPIGADAIESRWAGTCNRKAAHELVGSECQWFLCRVLLWHDNLSSGT